MFLSVSICNKIPGFWNKKATPQFCPQINSANLVSTGLVMHFIMKSKEKSNILHYG